MTPLDVDLIVVTGYAGAGKDEVVKILEDCSWRRASFADPLRVALYTLDPSVHFGEFNLSGLVDRHGWEYAKREYPEVRELLQRMGTDVGRNLFGGDFWVNQALARIAADGGTRYAFSDGRFLNEVNVVRSRGGRVWRVTRPGIGPINDHISEVGLDSYPFDSVIDNDGDLDQLHDRVIAELTLNYRIETS